LEQKAAIPVKSTAHQHPPYPPIESWRDYQMGPWSIKLRSFSNLNLFFEMNANRALEELSLYKIIQTEHGSQ